MAEIEFRDGTREVEDYIRDMLRGIETYKFSFTEAIQLANRKMASDYLERKRNDIIKEHFRDLR